MVSDPDNLDKARVMENALYNFEATPKFFELGPMLKNSGIPQLIIVP